MLLAFGILHVVHYHAHLKKKSSILVERIKFEYKNESRT